MKIKMKVGMREHLNWTFPISVTLRPCWLTFVTLVYTKLIGWTDPRPVPQSYQPYREAVRRCSRLCEVHLSLRRDRQAGCLKVIMAFNLSQRWFIWAWLASQTTDLKAWNENYYLGSLISHFEYSECGERRKGGKKENRRRRLYIQ